MELTSVEKKGHPTLSWVADAEPLPPLPEGSAATTHKQLKTEVPQGYTAIRTPADFMKIAENPSGKYILKKALDSTKDQSYVLYNLNQDQLAHMKFPLGGMRKPEIRQIAEDAGFVNARKHDSQDICFVPDGDYAAYIEEEAGVKFRKEISCSQTVRCLDGIKGLPIIR
mgnify:CR=1 FL=1